MRELKCRAWDAGEQRMIGPMSIWEIFGGLNNLFESTVTKEDIENAQKSGADGVESILLLGERLIARREQITWLQYTGLKDKNGKEIYEGDVIRITGISPAVYQGQKDTPYESVYHIEWGRLSWSPHWAEYEGVEILGNIYENPDLMAKN